MAKLEPPDLKQCQAERHNGANAFTLGGKPEYIRCTNKPTFIASETSPGKDGQRGRMSLCGECALILEKLRPKATVFKSLKK